jgi:hypothetical protein
VAATTRCVDSGWPNDPPSARHVGVLVGNRSPVRLNSAAPALWPPVLWLSKDPIGGRQTISAPAALLSLGVLPSSAVPATWLDRVPASAPRSMWLLGTSELGRFSGTRRPFAHVGSPQSTATTETGTLSTTTRPMWSGVAAAATWRRTDGLTLCASVIPLVGGIRTTSARAVVPSSNRTGRVPCNCAGAPRVVVRSVLTDPVAPR